MSTIIANASISFIFIHSELVLFRKKKNEYTTFYTHVLFEDSKFELRSIIYANVTGVLSIIVT